MTQAILTGCYIDCPFEGAYREVASSVWSSDMNKGKAKSEIPIKPPACQSQSSGSVWAVARGGYAAGYLFPCIYPCAGA